MINKLSLTILFIIVAGCSKFEFVHDKNLMTNPLKNKTSVSVVGDNIPLLKTELKKTLGTSNNIDFELNISSKEETTNIVKESNMTASLIQIKQTVVYELKLLEKNCIIITKKISNSRKFDSKAEGYNFGSDLSKKEIIEDLIKENTRQFLSFITANFLILDC